MTQAFNLSQLANNLNTSGQLDGSDGLFNAVPVANGGTALTTLGASGNMLLATGATTLSSVTMPTFGFRNRIINGAMVIDQRNAGASVSNNLVFTVDRWQWYYTSGSTHTIQQSTDAPTGFSNSLKVTVGTGASPSAAQQNIVWQPIEGYNVSDLSFGSAGAATITFSFWVKSSLTGTFNVWLHNSGDSRSYVSSYTISAANTWEQKAVTIAGDTTGTWLKTNGQGLVIGFSLGCGSNFNATVNTWSVADYKSTSGATNVIATSGATIQFTGVQLEKGSTATSFDYRPYGTELALCQRYYETSFADGVAPGTLSTGVVNTGAFGLYGSYAGSFGFPFKIRKRAAPTVTVYAPLDGTSSGRVRRGDNGAINTVSSPLISQEYANMNIDSGVSGAIYQFGFAATAEL